MSAGIDERTYIHDLEESLQLILFSGDGASTGVVVLVRGALASGDRARAERLVPAVQRLAEARPGEGDMRAAAAHVRGLVNRDSALLDHAASEYSAPLARAWATEDAGLSRAAHGKHRAAEAQLRLAYAEYERLGCTEGMARVRALLRASGVRLHHWTRAERPAFGWESLTETERRIVDLVAQGLSNRQVASQVFLSVHTVAFHLRHVFWKLGLTSRVQLARLAAEHGSIQLTATAPAGS
jgi:DNA-binding CsgD family transcriptional regulator